MLVCPQGQDNYPAAERINAMSVAKMGGRVFLRRDPEMQPQVAYELKSIFFHRVLC
jgi:hypothetical protein